MCTILPGSEIILGWTSAFAIAGESGRLSLLAPIGILSEWVGFKNHVFSQSTPSARTRHAASFTGTRLHPGSDWRAHPLAAHSGHYPGSLLGKYQLERPLISQSEPLLVVVLGPTGSGKTALSLVLGERFGGEIVNCDSVAMYRDFEIGTAKPSADARARVPHHLLDFVDPTGYMSAGEYARCARHVLEEMKAREKLPIVVGGTGLYLRALLEGLSPAPPRSNELRRRLRQRGQEKGSAYLHKLLTRLDPAAGIRIHANDTPKLIRALEVRLASRQTITELWKQGRDPQQGFRILRIGLDPDRDQLYARINERAQRMFEAGLVDETRELLQKYAERAWPLNSLGYRQAVQLLRGQWDQARALDLVRRAHRNYAKRQMTWFRREPGVIWLKGFGDEPWVQSEAAARIQGELGSQLPEI
jgi:tRNA dimethylallyltransferase